MSHTRDEEERPGRRLNIGIVNTLTFDSWRVPTLDTTEPCRPGHGCHPHLVGRKETDVATWRRDEV